MINFTKEDIQAYFAGVRYTEDAIETNYKEETDSLDICFDMQTSYGKLNKRMIERFICGVLSERSGVKGVTSFFTLTATSEHGGMVSNPRVLLIKEGTDAVEISYMFSYTQRFSKGAAWDCLFFTRFSDKVLFRARNVLKEMVHLLSELAQKELVSGVTYTYDEDGLEAVK